MTANNTTMTANNLLCWSTPEEILDLLKEYASKEDLSTVERFVRRRFDPELRDFATSLVILGSDTATTLGAHLQLAQGIADLPLLRREGDQPPYVMGRELGFLEEVISDPLLMRAGCLFLTRDAAAQTMLELLCKAHTAEFPGDGKIVGSRKLSESLSNPSAKCDFMNEIKRVYDGHIDAGKIRSEVMEKVGLVEYLEDAKLDNAADNVVIEQHRRFAQSVLDGNGSDHTSGSCAALDQRHLGRNRLILIGKICEEELTSRRILVQGVGDLSFNNGCVAFYRDTAGNPHVVLPRGEPYDLRSYTCLVAWKPPAEGPHPDGKFLKSIQKNGFGAANAQFAIIRVRLRPSPACIELEDGEDISKFVDFAVSGRQIIDAGKVVPAARIAPDFSDRRHVFRLANIGEVGKQRCPHPLFGHEAKEAAEEPLDLWLLEQILIEHVNLTKVACDEPISVPLSKLGCGESWADNALLAAGYKNTRALEPLEHGQYTWRGAAHRELRIFLARNVYPCTMIGLGNPDGCSTIKQAYYSI